MIMTFIAYKSSLARKKTKITYEIFEMKWVDDV